MNTHTYKGYTLKQYACGTQVYRNRLFITWFLNVEQAMRCIDELTREQA